MNVVVISAIVGFGSFIAGASYSDITCVNAPASTVSTVYVTRPCPHHHQPGLGIERHTGGRMVP